MTMKMKTLHAIKLTRRQCSTVARVTEDGGKTWTSPFAPTGEFEGPNEIILPLCGSDGFCSRTLANMDYSSVEARVGVALAGNGEDQKQRKFFKDQFMGDFEPDQDRQKEKMRTFRKNYGSGVKAPGPLKEGGVDPTPKEAIEEIKGTVTGRMNVTHPNVKEIGRLVPRFCTKEEYDKSLESDPSDLPVKAELTAWKSDPDLWQLRQPMVDDDPELTMHLLKRLLETQQLISKSEDNDG